MIPRNKIDKALCVINGILPESKLEVFLHLASYNLLNAAIKDKEYKNLLSYAIIKSRLSRLFTKCIKSNFRIVDDLSCSFGERCLYVRCFDLQFSFHNVSTTYFLIHRFINSDANIVRNWDGIRLQPIAETIFDIALRDNTEKELTKTISLLKDGLFNQNTYEKDSWYS